MSDTGKPVQATTIADAVARAEFAARLARRLLDFPLTPQPGDTMEQHAECLEVSYAGVILAALNDEAGKQ